MAAASSVMASLSLKPSGFTVEKTVAGRGLPSLARTSSLRVEASGGKKIKTDKPYGNVSTSFFFFFFWNKTRIE